jgi:chromosome segregation ATPase
VDQTKLIDRAEGMKQEMERRIEDLKADMDHLDQRRAEAIQLENEFVKIKRLEDDVNAKMTRFLSEKRRIETMEADFSRLLQISRAVEEKLIQVTNSDDLLQGVQLQIRKLEEALGTAEDRFQRMEKKSQVLDNTNDGIDRNFKLLQESEKLSSRIGNDLTRFTGDIDFMKTAIEKLAGESERAREAVDRIDVLDNALEEIEERIKSMQRVRQSIAEAETRFENLNREAQVQAKAIDSLMKGKKGGPSVDLGEGAPSPQKKENVIILARQGWPKEAIAKSLKMSIGEVELILEMAPRD